MQFLVAGAALIALIIVHEFGHFIAAKLSGMRVDEFGLGYPPRALRIGKIGETEYTLNWLPFGGFVKIYGEDAEQEIKPEDRDPRAFGARPRVLQAIVLIAGISMNLLFAYLLITGALIAGTPRALSDAELSQARNLELAVSNVLPSSPAMRAGLLAGDSIMDAKDAQGKWRASDSKSFSAYIADSNGSTVTLGVKRDGKMQTLEVIPARGLLPSDPTRYAIGVEVGTIGVVPMPFLQAIVEGANLTWGVITLSAKGLAHFFYGIFTFSADLSQVAGPIGITVFVGAATTQGLGNLLSIIAIISVSLALINLIPIPALDGGRLLFVIIEGIIRRPIHAKVANAINVITFALLIPLMLVVSAHDIFKLIG
ncbi:site-2 protease family protein [Patescibacteria group bacterium]|nr:site-2 protease family protein [Patescibacteria group bacterium]